MRKLIQECQQKFNVLLKFKLGSTSSCQNFKIYLTVKKVNKINVNLIIMKENIIPLIKKSNESWTK